MKKHLCYFLFWTLFASSLAEHENDVLTDSGHEIPSDPNLKSVVNFKSKTRLLAEVFRKKMNHIKAYNETELVILVDGSSSIGEANFRSEMKYIHKVISDVHLGPSAFRLAVIIYSTHAKTHVNHLETETEESEKCSLLHYHLPYIKYKGGSTNTKEALMETERILLHSRPNAQRLVFLVTDGFSNKGDPVPVAERLKKNFVKIFTFGIENGNVEELRRLASRPVQEHSYLFESFGEFEGFERRALHEDLKPGTHVVVKNTSLCDFLCENPKDGGCCHEDAKCSCGMLSGHFSCLCPPGYFGSGLKGQGCKLCPNGTYSDGTSPGDDLVCFPCPDKHQVTLKVPATSKADCVCVDGYLPDGDKCKVITCPDLSPPKNGYFVKKVCSNVLNAACGIRCHMGFTLSGSSVRICQKNGTWSGTTPVCQPKVCDPIKPVTNSDMICANDEDRFKVVIRYNATGDRVKHFVKWQEPKDEEIGSLKKFKKLQEIDPTSNTTTEVQYTVDTECSYSCLPGFFLVGSKSRSCLPMLRWSGLKTTCKAIKCHALVKIENGTVTPENCTAKGLKHHFGESCSYSCNSGYELKGPNTTNCTGRHGTWTGKNQPSKCVDVEPPKFECPQNLTVSTDEGVHFATVTLSLPEAVDNSGKDPIVWSKPPIEKDRSLRFIIGDSEVQIYSVDDSGNYGFCSFTVVVKDTENPKILECESPPVFFTSEFPPNSTEIKWKEPVVDDNSGVPIPLIRNPSTSEFPLGVTTINYTAKDFAGNNASCSLNITILENPCSERPEITNTRWNCTVQKGLVMCEISCSEGFAFASTKNSSNLLLNCTYQGRKAHWTPDIFHGDMELFPECSETETPTEVLEEIELEASEELCEDLENLSNEISNDIGLGLENKTEPLFIVCEDDETEETKTEEEKEETENKEKLEEESNVIRKKRQTKRKKKLRIGFSVKAEDGELEKNGLENIQLNKTKDKIRKFYAKHDSKIINPELSLRPNRRLKCRKGSLLRNNLCVKCPKGTFHNIKTATCDACPIGQYQEVEGQVSCISCPEGYSTRKIRRKHVRQCKKICPAGTFGRRKTKIGLALSPCTSCPVGSFQPHEGQTNCEQCPEGFTTIKRGSSHESQCMSEPELEDLCFGFRCFNGGTCVVSEGFAVCRCLPTFLGSFCEKVFNPCGSSPCYNGGTCVSTDSIEYECKCQKGFEGELCEKEINECKLNPCGVHGECVDLFDGFRCNCFPGFRGENCQERISPCEDLQPCLNQGTCTDVESSYTCQCPEGYTGFHCEEPISCFSENCTDETTVPPQVNEFDPCRNFVCEENKKCEVRWNRTPHCICIDGFRGENCSEVINPHVVLNFPKYGVSEYLSADLPDKDLSAISICLWIRTKDKFNYGTLFSYATFHDDNTFTLTDYSGLVLYATGNHVVTDLTANDGLWHFICVSWKSDGGIWKIYLDGSEHTSGSGLSTNLFIPGGGKLIVGQEQDFFGGGFNELESFSGKLTYVDVWDVFLTPEQVKNLHQDCSQNFGTLVSWPQLLQNVHGDIMEEESKFCDTCVTNLTLFHGKISYEQVGSLTTAKYECDEGFFLKFDSDTTNASKIDSWSRKCTKSGTWDWREPKCSRVSCGFPGYLYSGKIIGGSFLFGDVIEYSCDGEYELIGNDTRVCQADGTWSGETPSCRGNSNNCRKLVAPRHGSMFVYFTGVKTYGSALPSIGDRVEFTCDKGYLVKGFGVLTCLNGGVWDREPPICQEIKCPFPKEASHLIDLNVPTTASFYLGDSLSITCNSGAQKLISCGELGAWNFSVQTCEPKCFEKPKNPQNGFVLDDNRYDYSYEEGETLYVKCNPGYVLLGDSRLTCSENGTWSQFRPTICDPLSCGPPPHPPHPFFLAYEEGHRFGNKVHLDCVPGYRKTGEIITQCGVKGKWSRIQNTCQKISCQTPRLPDGYSLEDERPNYYFEDVSRISCPQGTQLQNASLDYIVCQSNGLWSQIPECV